MLGLQRRAAGSNLFRRTGIARSGGPITVMTALELASMDPPPTTSARPAVGDGELVRRACAGDLAAFEAIYRRHVGRVHAICRRVTGRRERAEEMTQETFLLAWRKLSTLRQGSELRAWLSRVAVNVSLGEWRSRGRHRSRERPLEDAGPVDERAPAGGGAALDLGRAIDRLPPGARAAFVLHDVEGYRHPEIARMMGVTVGTTKAQLHRARRLLREALNR
jgi:RNA polymerase sigma-70 factor (ECF subfamily)